MDQNTPILQHLSFQTKTNKYVYVLTFFSAIGGFLFGYDTGVISGAMIILKKNFMLSDFWQELLVAITVGFAALFSLVGGVLNSWKGRRYVIILASFIFLLGSILLAAAVNKEMLLLGRAIVGAGIGLASMTVPMYIAEVSPPHVRGRLVSVNNLFITGGQFVASCIDGLFSVDEINGWRFMLGLAAVPAFLQMVGFVFLPESPRWLMQKEKYDKAIVSLQKVLGDNADARKEYNTLLEFVKEERHGGSNGTFCRALRDKGVRRALMVGCGLQMFQQLAGINTVMYYSATIVQMSGVRDDTVAIWLAAATSFVNFIFTFVGVWLVERMGRRFLILISIAGVIFSLLFLSTGFYLSSMHSPNVSYNVSYKPDAFHCLLYSSCISCIESLECGFCYTPVGSQRVHNATCLPLNSSDHQISLFGPCDTKHDLGPYFASNYCPTGYSWMALVGMVLYLAFFAPGMGPMPWTINSEIYPQWARSIGNASSTTTNWLFNVLVSLTFLDITRLLSTQGAFLLYAILSLFGFFFIFLFLPETKGKPLEEIERLFQNSCIVCWKKNTSSTYHVILDQRQLVQEDNDNEGDMFVK